MCTGIRLTANNNATIYARTMEFGQDIASNIIIIPRNYQFIGTAPEGSGMHWKSEYAIVGANTQNIIGILDGLNEKGLAGGLFYFPEYAQYQEVTSDKYPHTIAPWELITFLLTTCATVDQAKQKLSIVNVSNTVFGPWGIVPPTHAIIHDAAGNSLVIEYVKGKLRMYDNPLGVITNSPSFDWHITNLRNYINLSAINVPKIELDKISLSSFGQGSGMLGLPGDFTPPSRFVRAVAFSQSVVNLKTEKDALAAAFHILNLFDIPFGVVGQKDGDAMHFDYTQWTSASDTRNACYYWHTYMNRNIKMINLIHTNMLADTHTIIPMETKEIIEDITPT
jgi:choloylglycine hydrolase